MKDKRHDVVESWQDIGVRGVARFWKAQMPGSYREAQREFVRLVDPYVSHVALPRGTDAEVTNMMFVDWLAYDFAADEGLTPLELVVQALAKKGRERVSNELAQVACTQFFSEFWVCWQMPEEGVSLIEDAVTGAKYRLADKAVASTARWADGLLSMRIACVGDAWHDVGIAPMHDNFPSRADYADDWERLVEDHPECTIAGPSGRGINYLAFARQLLGPDGGYLPSLELHHYVG